MGQQGLHGVGLGDVLHTHVAEQCGLPGAAPGAVLHLGEGFLGIQSILIAVQHIADLVQIVAVQLPVPDHAGEGFLIRDVGAGIAALAAAVLCHDAHRHVLEGAAGKQAVVALQVEFQAPGVQPVHDAAALVRRDELVHHHHAVRLHIAAVAADVAVDADVPDLLLVLGLAAAAAQIHLVAVGPRLADGIHCGSGQAVLVVHQRAVNVDQ